MESFLQHSGYLALVVLAFAEACCIPFPSEITFGFAGFLSASGSLGTSGHHLNLVAVIVLGTVAEVAGSFVSYGIGRVGGRPLVERVGRYVLLTTADLDRAERWFDGRGEFSVLVGRAMPLIRSFVSVVAGVAEMSPLRFGVFSLIGTAIYTAAVASAGYALNGAWHSLVHGFSLAGYVLAALVVVTVAAFIAHRWSSLRKQGPRPEVSRPGPSGQPD
ncbi:MAG TPA: DedA family protein [Acidimicrobiales bacterium]|nr:DedA family protein [Acidimicrobiales bacterium]